MRGHPRLVLRTAGRLHHPTARLPHGGSIPVYRWGTEAQRVDSMVPGLERGKAGSDPRQCSCPLGPGALSQPAPRSGRPPPHSPHEELLPTQCGAAHPTFQGHGSESKPGAQRGSVSLGKLPASSSPRPSASISLCSLKLSTSQRAAAGIPTPRNLTNGTNGSLCLPIAGG